MKPRAVIFDADGTLLDSIPLILQKHNEVAKSMGFGTVTQEQFVASSGYGWGETIRMLWPGVDVKAFKQNFREWEYQAYSPVKGSLEVLQELHEEGCVLGIVTNKLTERIIAELENSGFDTRVFDFVHGRDKCAAEKPHGGALANALAHLREKGVGQESVVYVGDSLVDKMACEQAGVKFIGVLTGFGTREELGDAIESVAVLRGVLE